MRELSNRLNIVTPLTCEYWPVRIAARLGVQIELVAKTLVSSAPSRASRLMCGVGLMREPYALIACAAWSSLMMKMMFGRPACRVSTSRRTDATATATSTAAYKTLAFMEGRSLMATTSERL